MAGNRRFVYYSCVSFYLEAYANLGLYGLSKHIQPQTSQVRYL